MRPGCAREEEKSETGCACEIPYGGYPQHCGCACETDFPKIWMRLRGCVPLPILYQIPAQKQRAERQNRYALVAILCIPFHTCQRASIPTAHPIFQTPSKRQKDSLRFERMRGSSIVDELTKNQKAMQSIRDKGTEEIFCKAFHLKSLQMRKKDRLLKKCR